MSEPKCCPNCGSVDFDWSWRDNKYGCYICGKMFDGIAPKQIREQEHDAEMLMEQEENERQAEWEAEQEALAEQERLEEEDYYE